MCQSPAEMVEKDPWGTTDGLAHVLKAFGVFVTLFLALIAATYSKGPITWGSGIMLGYGGLFIATFAIQAICVGMRKMFFDRTTIFSTWAMLTFVLVFGVVLAIGANRGELPFQEDAEPYKFVSLKAREGFEVVRDLPDMSEFRDGKLVIVGVLNEEAASKYTPSPFIIDSKGTQQDDVLRYLGWAPDQLIAKAKEGLSSANQRVYGIEIDRSLLRNSEKYRIQWLFLPKDAGEFSKNKEAEEKRFDSGSYFHQIW